MTSYLHKVVTMFSRQFHSFDFADAYSKTYYYNNIDRFREYSRINYLKKKEMIK
jgi:hypothetical protein